jgi:hypothetical protein
MVGSSLTLSGAPCDVSGGGSWQQPMQQCCAEPPSGHAYATLHWPAGGLQHMPSHNCADTDFAAAFPLSPGAVHPHPQALAPAAGVAAQGVVPHPRSCPRWRS